MAKNSIGQLFFCGISGFRLTDEEKTWLKEKNIGGVCLFGRNCQSPEQLFELCAEIQSLSEKKDFFIAIDMEGGRVHRLKAPFTQWPALANLGKIDNPTASFQFAEQMGLELNAVGINLDFAPSVDVLTEAGNPAIGDRALSADFAVVEKHASALVRGYLKSGIICCVKHFPGHGNTKVDSHFELPRESTSKEVLLAREIAPFKKAFKSKVPMVLTSHLLFENIDPKNPVTFSSYFLQDLLRGELRYRGLVITDDLGMKALANYGDSGDISVKALLAGHDMLLFCNDFKEHQLAYQRIETEYASGNTTLKNHIDSSLTRIALTKEDFFKDRKTYTLKEASDLVGNPEHKKTAAAIAECKAPEVKPAFAVK